jgi:anti-sigma28 factor (negative regulator of flagellin synthesis)
MRQPSPALRSNLVTDESLAECGSCNAVDLLASETSVSSVELDELRKERLETIRQAILKGDYDSDALLEKAVNRMVVQLQSEEPEISGSGARKASVGSQS